MQEKYQCHICMEIAVKPVVTPCGHLFCWPCIYQWLRSNQEYLSCPICKSGLEMSTLRPILLKDEPPETNEYGLPPRPRPHVRRISSARVSKLPKSIARMGMSVQRGVLLAGYGLFPSAFLSLTDVFVAPKKKEGELDEISLEYSIYRVLFLITVVIVIALLCVTIAL